MMKEIKTTFKYTLLLVMMLITSSCTGSIESDEIYKSQEITKNSFNIGNDIDKLKIDLENYCNANKIDDINSTRGFADSIKNFWNKIVNKITLTIRIIIDKFHFDINLKFDGLSVAWYFASTNPNINLLQQFEISESQRQNFSILHDKLVSQYNDKSLQINKKDLKNDIFFTRYVMTSNIDSSIPQLLKSEIEEEYNSIGENEIWLSISPMYDQIDYLNESINDRDDIEFYQNLIQYYPEIQWETEILESFFSGVDGYLIRNQSFDSFYFGFKDIIVNSEIDEDKKGILLEDIEFAYDLLNRFKGNNYIFRRE